MQKILLFVILSVLHTQVSAAINCEFKSQPVSGISSLQLTEESLLINGQVEIALEKSIIRCGSNAKRARYEGAEDGLQVILKDCSPDNQLEGHLIDSVKQEIADIKCF